jgi:CheY-like chemotaxis protein
MTAATTLLVVDDDPGIRSMVALVLEDEGFRVATAANGAEALARVRAEPFGGILLDMMMPVMDGPTFLATWGSEAPHRRAPVVAMSANRAAGEALRLGAVDFVAKPFDIEQLVRVVACAFGPGQRSALSPVGAAR